MSRIPHLYLPAPWPDSAIPLTAATHHHLLKVLRLTPGAEVSYTDGQGTVGGGLLGNDEVARGSEERSDLPEGLITVAVAAPTRVERARFVVEKLAELGVDRLVWLDADRGEGRPPSLEKARAWAVAALEQSQGAFLMEVSGPVEPGALEGPLVAAVPGGGAYLEGVGGVTLLVGPEGGWADDELPEGAVGVGLGSRTLRTETAAIVFATLAMERAGRLTLGGEKKD